MRQTLSVLATAARLEPLTLDDLERHLTQSPTVARCLIVGLPSLGILGSLVFGLPLFAALMCGSFLLATALVARKALVRFASRTLRLLVAARLMIVLVLGALLVCTSGSTWVGIVSTLLLWLTTDRLLGRHALADLGKLVRNRQPAEVIEGRRPGRVRPVEVMSSDDLTSDATEEIVDGRLFESPQAPVVEGNQPRRRGRGKA